VAPSVINDTCSRARDKILNFENAWFWFLTLLCLRNASLIDCKNALEFCFLLKTSLQLQIRTVVKIFRHCTFKIVCLVFLGQDTWFVIVECANISSHCFSQKGQTLAFWRLLFFPLASKHVPVIEIHISMHNTQREPWWDKMTAPLYYIMDLLNFIVLMKIQFAIYLKHSSFWPLGSVKP